MKCSCGRLELGEFDGIGSTDSNSKERGSHTRSQCYDTLGRRRPSTAERGLK